MSAELKANKDFMLACIRQNSAALLHAGMSGVCLRAWELAGVSWQLAASLELVTRDVKGGSCLARQGKTDLQQVIEDKEKKSTHKDKYIRLNRSCRGGPGGRPPQTKRKKPRLRSRSNSKNAMTSSAPQPVCSFVDYILICICTYILGAQISCVRT